MFSTLYFSAMPKLSPNRELPVAITNLRLCSALWNCGATSVEDAFDKSSVNPLFVYEDKESHYTDWTDQEPEFVSKCFKVVNPNGNTIVLLPLDGRVLTAAAIIQGGVCDCMLLTEKEMCLIEFKTNATSSSYLTIKQRANEAVKQLWHTFDGIVRSKCVTKKINIEQLLSIDFYVVFDKELEIARVNSALMDLQVEFLEENKHKLYFANEKTFH